MQSVLLFAATLAAAQAPDQGTGLCCTIPDFGSVCTTDVGKDGGRSVTIKQASRGKKTATVEDHRSAPDGVYPCLDTFTTGTPVF
jgi:hypothetical protein